MGNPGQGKVAHATLKGGTLANTVNSDASNWPAVANAHAVLANFCGLKSPTRRSAALANAVNSVVSGWLAIANAQTVLASYCAMNSHMRHSAALANL